MFARYELAAFIVAGGFAGLAGALFGIFNRGVFADFLYWPKSAEVLIMTILGGMNHFWGPSVGTGLLVLLNQQITSYTEYWPLVLGAILLVLLFVFPGGLVGALVAGSLVPGAQRSAPPRCLKSASCRKSFARLHRGVRGEPDRGERQIAAVIGPNGAGKSTFFNLITGHLGPDAGHVIFKDADITGMAPHRICRMGIGRSFQRTNIFPKLTVFENVQAALLAHRGRGRNFWSRSESFYRDETEALLASIGLIDQADAVAGTLSLRQPEAARAWPGARLRSGTAAAGRTDRRHVGDRDARTIRLLERIAGERGLTLLFTEHDMEVVFSIAQKIAVLHQGRKIADGTPEEVRTDPEVRRIYLGRAL